MNVLVVDPSKTYADLISNLLNDDAVTSDIIYSGQGALNYFQNHTPDAICVAHELEDMNSHELILQLVQKNRCVNVPKFLITSFSTDEFRRKSYDAGYTEIFQKTDVIDLQHALQSMLQYSKCRTSAIILYVEDVQSTALYTINIMQKMGWEVTHVDTGEDALELFESHEFDLVITDLILAGKISGLNLINKIREHGSEIKSQIPILAMSVWNDILRQVYVLQHGASDFVPKPFEQNDFIARALNLIQNKRELDESVSARKVLFDKANADQLTGLANRRYFDEYAHKLVKQMVETGNDLSFLLIGIDHFKKINDVQRHTVGDEVLRQTGLLLNKYCRQDDMPVRLGGEEFTIILPKCHQANALLKAERIRENIEKLNPVGISMTVSIGVSSIHSEKSSTLDSLYVASDEALYIAKNGGRNRVVAACL